MLVLQQEKDTEDAVVEIWWPDGRVVEVELISLRENRRARMGYTAPPDVQVHRRSVANRIRAANRAAAPVHIAGMAPICGPVDATGGPCGEGGGE